jgi:hypothetical protein
MENNELREQEHTGVSATIIKDGPPHTMRNDLSSRVIKVDANPGSSAYPVYT